ncbi:unnamed protein product [Sphagnum balticum]
MNLLLDSTIPSINTAISGANSSAGAAVTTANAASAAVTALQTTVTTNSNNITTLETEVAALGGGYQINPASGVYGTWDQTGTTDVSGVLQAAINAAIAARLPLFIPPGIYKIASTVHLTPARNATQTLQMYGVGTQSGSEPTFTNSGFYPYTIFVKTFNNAPCFDATGYRNVHLSNFVVTGQNQISQYQFPNRFDSNYVTGGARDSQYSPDCGISFDAFVPQSGTVALPPDGGYPTLTSCYSTSNKAGSNVLMENVSVCNHVVNVAICPSGVGSLTDQTKLKNCYLSIAKVNLSLGNSQNKITIFDGGGMGSAQTGIDTVRYGSGSACAPTEVHALNMGNMYEIFNHNDQASPLSMHDCYGETIRRIGSFGAASSTNRQVLDLQKMPLTLYTGGSQGGIPGGIPLPAIIMETYGPTLMQSITLGINTGNQYFWNLVSDAQNSFNSPIEMVNCGLKSGPTGPLMPFVGAGYSNGSHCRLKECYSNGTYPSLPMSDDSTNDIANFTFNNRVSSVGIKGSRYSNGTSVVDYVSPNTTGYVTLAVSGLTLNSQALTLTSAPAAGTTNSTATTNFTGTTNMYPVTFSTGEVQYAILQNGSAVVNWLNSPLANAASTAISVQNVTLSFTYTGTALQVGDILLWQQTPLNIGGVGNKRTVPTWQISSISGTTYTCIAQVEATTMDTVANNPANVVSVLQYQWAPYGQNFAGTAASGSTSLTGVTPAIGILNGDWVKDTAGYLPANTRVVSGAGSGTLVLNNAATGSGVTNLYFGEFTTPTSTPTWT